MRRVDDEPSFRPRTQPVESRAHLRWLERRQRRGRAAGLVTGALGTDTAGSVRIPAAFCGVTGVRPSWGLVSTRGVVPTAWSLDTVGPLARSAEECERLLETMAAQPLGGRSAGNDLRVGIVTSLFERADPAVRRCASERSTSCPGEGAGCAPAPRRAVDCHAADHAPGGPSAHLPWLRTRLADYGADVRARLLAGLLLPSTAYHRPACASLGARRVRECARRLRRLVAPPMPITAPRLDAIPEDYRLLLMPYNSPAALSRAARAERALRLRRRPAGWAVAHRPPRRGRHAAGAAQAFQQATDWHDSVRSGRWHALPVDQAGRRCIQHRTLRKGE